MLIILRENSMDEYLYIYYDFKCVKKVIQMIQILTDDLDTNSGNGKL